MDSGSQTEPSLPPLTFPLPTAYTRDWAVPGIEFARYAALAANWKHSQAEIIRIRDTLSSAGLPPEVRTVAVAGSLGRMEAASEAGVSDCDLLIVLTDKPDRKTAEANDLSSAVWNALGPLNLDRPKKDGVFHSPTDAIELCSTEKIGKHGEDVRTFAKRLLLLLETQPVYNDAEYEATVGAVVDMYAKDYVDKDPRKEWGFLLNDLIRYFRSICVNYQWDFRNDGRKWRIRNVKLRHSRLVMYGGLLALLGECSRDREDKVKWLKNRLSMTPLERLAWAYGESGDTNFFRVAGFYDTFLGLMSQKEVRKRLGDADNDSYQARYKNRDYALLKANSDAAVAELLRFTLARHGRWSERFFEYLIF